MTPMNNPLAQIVQLIQNGRKPGDVFKLMAQRDPRGQMIIQMMGGKSPAQMEQMVRNMCAERGTTVEDLARSLGITIPSNR